MKSEDYSIDSSYHGVVRNVYLRDSSRWNNRMIDSMYHSIVDVVTKEKWVLYVYQHDKTVYRLEENDFKDTIIFRFSEKSKLLDKGGKEIGKWHIALKLDSMFYFRAIGISLHNEYIDDLAVPKMDYLILILKDRMITLDRLFYLEDRQHHYFFKLERMEQCLRPTTKSGED